MSLSLEIMRIGIIVSREDYTSENAPIFTTPALSYHAADLGHEVYLFTMDDVMRGINYGAHGARVHSNGSLEAHIESVRSGLSTRFVNMRGMDAMFLRANPAKNCREMQHMVRMWEYLAGMEEPLMVNNPAKLRQFSDKRILLNFPDYIPHTEVYETPEQVLDAVFGRSDIGVIKPAFGTYGGAGVHILSRVLGDSTKEAELRADVVKYLGSEIPYLGQHFVEDDGTGDKRVIVFDGKIMGLKAVTRLMGRNGKHNTAEGGIPVPADFTDFDREVAAKVYPFYREAGMLTVGFDIIGGKIGEGNVVCVGGSFHTDLNSKKVDPRFVPIPRQMVIGVEEMVGER
tara:strand:+ start:450 stop:1478 length:1029 start_codon:yes stop_codon:yes gene_type:complete